MIDSLSFEPVKSKFIPQSILKVLKKLKQQAQQDLQKEAQEKEIRAKKENLFQFEKADFILNAAACYFRGILNFIFNNPELMNTNLLVIIILSLICSNALTAQSSLKNNSFQEQYLIYFDSVPEENTCTDSYKTLSIRTINRELSDFTIIKTELWIKSTDTFFSVYSSTISNEMQNALKKLSGGTEILFKVTAVNTKKQTIMTTGRFLVN